MRKNKSGPLRLKKISLAPLSPADALRAAFATPPPPDSKPKPKASRKPKKR